MTERALRRAPLVAALLLAAACGAGGESAARAAAIPDAAARPAAARTVVDSILPIAEELHRFRADLADTARELAGGERSRDALVARFVRALETRDTASVRGMLLTASEFAWLYYPTSINARPPYELGPGLAWFQLQNGSSKGISRSWRRFAGAPLGVVGYDCPVAPDVHGGNRIWTDCTLSRRVGRETSSIRLFGAIVEREGRFKFLSYASDL
jgi:hypothetical protein